MTAYWTCIPHISPEIIIGEAVKIALLKSSLVWVTVADRAVVSRDGVDATIGKCLSVKSDDVAKAKSSTTHKQVANTPAETEQSCAGTTTNVQKVML